MTEETLDLVARVFAELAVALTAPYRRVVIRLHPVGHISETEMEGLSNEVDGMFERLGVVLADRLKEAASKPELIKEVGVRRRRLEGAGLARGG